MQTVANAVQLLGAVVTFLGLSHAYTRSKYGTGLWTWIKTKLRRRGPDQVISATGIASGEGFGFAGVAIGYAPFALDTALPVEGQLEQLAKHVRELRAMFGPIERDVRRLDSVVNDTRAYADSAAAQALTDAKAHQERAEAGQTEAAVLDLRVAISGTLIMVVGYVLAFFA